MGNFKHYIEKLKNGDGFFDERVKISVALTLTGILHAVFLILFILMGAIPMAVYNILTVAAYFSAPILAKQGKYKLLISLSVAEVVLHAALATVFIGCGAGFHLYVFCMIPVAFYLILICSEIKRKDIANILYSVLISFSYIFIYLYTRFFEPYYKINDAWNVSLMIMNIILSFAISMGFLFIIEWDILYKNTTLENKNSALNEMANKDPLTKLFNRRYMNIKLEEKLKEFGEHGNIFGIIMGDIDNFKNVNDTYGHDAGDDVLVAIADILRKNVRDDDVICRWGGEEFLIVINGNKKITYDVAERMRKSIENYEFNVTGDHVLKLTMTFGVTESIPGFNTDKLIAIADDNLYKGKQGGKNIVVL